MAASDWPTGATLFDVLARPDDPRAWERFVRRYGPLINAWCHRQRLQPADADDVIQTVLVKLYRSIAGFEWRRNGSFRAYLKTITANVIHDLRSKQARAEQELTLEPAAAGDFEKDLEQEFDREILQQAMVQVQGRVEPQTWDAFRLTGLEGC